MECLFRKAFVLFSLSLSSGYAIDLYRQVINNNGYGVYGMDATKFRGASDPFVYNFDYSGGWVRVINKFNPTKLISLLQVPPGSPVNQMATSVAYGNDPVTNQMIFIGGKQTTYNAGRVFFYNGLYTAWSVQQDLMPPLNSGFGEQNFFGDAIALEHNHMRMLAVGCSGCNVTHSQGGAIYIYEPTTPTAKKWTHISTLTTTTNVFRAGAAMVKIHKNIVIADVEDNEDASNSAADAGALVQAVVFARQKEGWTQLQVLGAGNDKTKDDITAMDVYDETVVIGSSGSATTTFLGFTSTGKVSVLYPSTDRFHLAPVAKAQPVQWSVQQVLVPPDAPSPGNINYEFGSLSIDQNRLAIGAKLSNLAFVYQRQNIWGKWSLQQVVTTNRITEFVLTRGSSLLTARNTGGNGFQLFDETSKWDCLAVSLEDHFNDGWDTAQLVVDVPDGDKDYFTSRCDTPNPFTFRYCPNSHEDNGLYRFSVSNGRSAKFHWEQVWRVYEEASGRWYTGNWESKMDFLWNSQSRQFLAKKIERVLPNNITCKECKSKPTSKHSSRLRQLHHSDHTASPTVSPAPTILSSVNIRPWQELTLITSASGVDWFDPQHKGTSYYISSKDGNHLLSTGTMCPWETNPMSKTCWEDFPDGEYILRVGGALDRTTSHSFKFCGSVNALSQETQIVFRIQNGECSIVSNIKSKNFCVTAVHLKQIAVIEFSLFGVSGLIGSIENAQLCSAIADGIIGTFPGDVTVLSTEAAETALIVTAEVLVDAKIAGIDYTNIDTLDAFEGSLVSALKSNVILSSLISGEVDSGLHTVTHMEVNSVQLTGNKEGMDPSISHSAGGGSEVINFADTRLVEDHGLGTSLHRTELIEIVVKVLAVLGFVLAAVGIAVGASFVIAKRHNDTIFTCSSTIIAATGDDFCMSCPIDESREEQWVSRDSLHCNQESERFPLKNSTPMQILSVTARKELIQQEDTALGLMLKNGGGMSSFD